MKPCSVFPSRRVRIRLNIAATPSAVRSRWGVGGCGRTIGAALGGAYPNLGDSRVRPSGARHPAAQPRRRGSSPFRALPIRLMSHGRCADLHRRPARPRDRGRSVRSAPRARRITQRAGARRPRSARRRAEART